MGSIGGEYGRQLGSPPLLLSRRGAAMAGLRRQYPTGHAAFAPGLPALNITLCLELLISGNDGVAGDADITSQGAGGRQA